MVLPLSAVGDSHPKGWANPINLRVSAALPAAGAWDAAPTESSSAGAHKLTVYFTYTEGGQDGGAFDWQLEVSGYSVVALAPAGANEWVTEAILAPSVVVAGADAQNTVQRDYQTYTVVTAGETEEFVFGPIELDGTVERIRIRARESGQVGTPGTLQITAVLQ